MNPHTDVRIGRITGAVLAALLLAGCATAKPYTHAAKRNLHIQTRAESGSVFSSVRAALDIYRVGADCKGEYLGTVPLNAPTVEVGVPAGQPSYLVFAFASSSFLGGSKSTVTYDTLLTPRAGSAYDVEVSYVDDLYNVAIRESRPGQRARREIRQRPLNACAAS